MELNYLRVFFEVAKVGTFTEAARKLHISQSALSRSVALLEESEGVQLFERTKKGVNLTPMGNEVFRYCEELFQTVQRIEEACRGIKEACAGPLRFATTDHVINYLLTLPLQNFRREYPEVSPRIVIESPDGIVDKLLNGEAEFGLSFVKVTSPQIEYEELREEPMALVVHPQIWRESRGVNQTAKLKKVLQTAGYISSIGVQTQSRPARVLRELFGEIPRTGIEVNNQETQKRICLAGGGVAYLARFMVGEEIRRGELHEIPIESAHAFTLWLATRRGHLLSVPSRTFLQNLRAQWKV